CSRLAKAALLASARDERIAVCVPVQTGGGGCPLAKRNYGETVQVLMLSFSHWFCKAYGKYAKEPWNTLPFDQHLLLASIAPRALLVLGFDNRWYDPKGEYLAVRAASPVWPFLGAGRFPDRPFPEVFDLSCVGRGIGYAQRSEKHGISAWDWKVMLDFADASFASVDD
ncbi:MAG: acetylxylan esterase, partial [Kiritimatiellae bacterium]|nr:acetylxylan esterase [Kiritimatiellia bacterium]